MENKQLLIGLLETVLGRGKKTSKDNYAYHCPFCNHKKPKLEVNTLTNEKNENFWHCWTCEAKGKTLESLFKRLKVSSDKLFELRTYVKGNNQDNQSKQRDKGGLGLPKEFISLANENPRDLTYKQAMYYLESRGYRYEDIVKYNIGYCETGKYRNRIIVPSYDKTGSLNYFIARSFEKDPTRKYDAPVCNKNEIIGFENLINWNVPIILCEGAFDAMSIRRNAIPLFGKTLSTALKTKLSEMQIKTVYLALDKDVLKQTLQYAQELINLGKEVYLIELEGKDPSELGFEKFTNSLHKASPLTFRTILSKKLELQ